MYKIFILSVFLSVTVALTAQNIYYFTDSLFIFELGEFLEPTYEAKPEVESAYNAFKMLWEQGSFDNYKFGIIYVANSMKENYAKAYPDFYNYIMTMNALNAKNDMDYYTEWEVGLLGAIYTKKINNIRDYLEFSKLLVIDSILVQTPSVVWKANSTDYVIGNDPETQTLFINFNNEIDLMCYNIQGQIIDTFIIEKTSGICYPSDMVWKGTQGKVTWRQVGLDGNKVFAKFNKYELDMKQSRFEIDNALFTNEFLNLFQIPGKLTVKLSQTKTANERPIFESNEKYFIKNILPEADFNGYFKMEGKVFKGYSKDEYAVVFIKDKGIPIANLRSKDFEIVQNSSIKSSGTKVSLYLNNRNDSIWQDNLIVSYSNKLDTIMYRKDWFEFNSESGQYLILSRSIKGLSRQPFQDTYHEYNIYGDKIVWAKGDSILYFVTTNEAVADSVIFESTNFFNQADYAYFSGQNTDNLNHLAEIRNFYDELAKTNDELNPKSYQKYLEGEFGRQINLTTLQTLFNELSYAGFIYYDRENDIAAPTDKLYRYLSNAGRIKQKKKEIKVGVDSVYKLQDFDKILIISMIGQKEVRATNLGVNAKINILNNELKIKYIYPVILSPSVMIITDELTVRENRNMRFGGEVVAGLSKLSGPDFKFNYDDYQIRVDNDQTSVQMWSADTVGNKVKYMPISTHIQNIQGVLYLNESDNKSNTIESESYPIMKTEQKAKIYYERFVQQFSTSDTVDLKQFNKDFYFEADNFYLDSLNYLTDSVVQFKGLMYTGLFDPLSVTLTVKKNDKGERSLGFTECTESNKDLQSGLEFKGGKFFGCFSLNDLGLFGDGYILYKSSYIQSKSFAFMPDEVTGVIDSFTIDKKLGTTGQKSEDIPYIYGKNTDFQWRDQMNFTGKEKKSEMIIYSDLLEIPGDLNGSLVYEDNFCIGKGEFQFEDANITDTNFIFKNKSFTVSACDFDLKIAQETAFKTRNLNGSVDITQKLGSFYSNDDTARIVFPDNYYFCIMDHFLWKIGEGIVNIGGVMPEQDTNDYAVTLEDKLEAKRQGKDIKLFGTILVAFADTLSFNASSTTYQLNEKIIIADNVQQIKISDAMIYPKGTVKIKEKGVIDTIKNISFEFPYKLFSNEPKSDYMYEFEQANVIIINRFHYKADKPKYYYEYKQQPVVFDNVTTQYPPKYDLSKKTSNFKKLNSYSVAYKKSLQGDTLMLSPDFEYNGFGQIKIYANERFLEFEGYCNIASTCNIQNIPVFEFKLKPTFIDPQNVVVEMFSRYEARKGNVRSGLYWEKKMISGQTNYDIAYHYLGVDDPNDEVIFAPNGFLNYHTKAEEYRIGDTNKIKVQNADTIWGDMMSFSKNLCIIKAQGGFNFFQNWDVTNKNNPDHIKSEFRGYYRLDVKEGIHRFQGCWAFDFITPQPIMDDLISKINLGTTNYPIMIERDRIEKNYQAFLGKPVTDLMFKQIDKVIDYDLPEKLNHTITFADINLVWSADSNALMSVGKLGIASINGQKVDRYIDGYVKYKNTKKVRMLIIILEPLPGVIYAFKYRYADNKGVMKIYVRTGDLKMDNYFDKMKEKDMTFKDYSWSKTTEPEFKSFAPEYVKE